MSERLPPKPSLLFLSPVLPAAESQGLAMRAGVFLQAYARRYQVTLVILPILGRPPAGPPPFVARYAYRMIVLSLEQLMHPLFRLIAGQRSPLDRRRAMRAYPRPRQILYDPIMARERLATSLAGERFDVVHVERLYTAPLAEDYLGQCRCVLDLDEDDARTLRRIALLRRASNDAEGADDDEADASKFDELIARNLPRFDLTLVAAEGEAASLASRYPAARIGVVPNAIRLPETDGRAKPAAAAIDFLMIGTLRYFPNSDAAAYFCRDILPRLGTIGAAPPRVAIVGRSPPPEVEALANLPGVRVHGNVPEVAPFYASAEVAIVPIRAGGGSRIKILEAFAHGVPVVSTSVGAEGLAVANGRHLLIADGAEEFAAAALRLRQDRSLARKLAAEARRFVERYHALPIVADAIEALAGRAEAVIESARSKNACL